MIQAETNPAETNPAETNPAETDTAETGPGAALGRLRAQFPWPALRPAIEVIEHGWFRPECARALTRFSAGSKVIMELGSWLGVSTRFLCAAAPESTVIAVDHFAGSAEHHLITGCPELLPRLYERFLSCCWEQRGQIIPLRADTQTGMATAFALGVRPDLIYVDAGHEYESVRADLRTICALFPEAQVVGDDYTDFPGVAQAAEESARQRGTVIERDGGCWWMEGHDHEGRARL